MATKTYKLPATFWYDHHVNRSCSDSAKVLRESARLVWVELDQDAYDDLASDCRFHIDALEQRSFDDMEYMRGICESARRTLARLHADPMGEVKEYRAYTLKNEDGGYTSFKAWSPDEAVNMAAASFGDRGWTVWTGA